MGELGSFAESPISGEGTPCTHAAYLWSNHLSCGLEAGEVLDERCRMLERLASEVSRLHYNAARAQASKLLPLAE